MPIALHNPFQLADTSFTHLQQMTFENIVAKEEIVHNEQFPIFITMF